EPPPAQCDQVHSRRGHVELAARRVDGTVTIDVRDSGVGIESAALPLVFEPFFTGFDTQHHRSGTFEFWARGLGLGLAIGKASAEGDGGRVTAGRRPGGGSVFTITIPAEPSRASD